MSIIQYKFNTCFGKFSILELDKQVIYIGLPNCKNGRIMDWCRKQLKTDNINKVEKGQTDAADQIIEFLNGKIKSFTFPYKLITTAFHGKALKSVADIPYGHTKSYKDIAVELQSPKAVRAVGSANASNPLPLVIPCHRVISHDGSLGGYGGGLDLKMKLLELEGCMER